VQRAHIHPFLCPFQVLLCSVLLVKLARATLLAQGHTALRHSNICVNLWFFVSETAKIWRGLMLPHAAVYDSKNRKCNAWSMHALTQRQRKFFFFLVKQLKHKLL
jgi:hypothetical protein